MGQNTTQLPQKGVASRSPHAQLSAAPAGCDETGLVFLSVPCGWVNLCPGGSGVVRALGLEDWRELMAAPPSPLPLPGAKGDCRPANILPEICSQWVIYSSVSPVFKNDKIPQSHLILETPNLRLRSW